MGYTGQLDALSHPSALLCLVCATRIVRWDVGVDEGKPRHSLEFTMRTRFGVLAGGSIAGLAGLGAFLLMPSSTIHADGMPLTLSLTGTIHDFMPGNGNPDFTIIPSATPGARSARNVALTLDADNKPVFVPNNGKRVNNEWRDGMGNKISWCTYQQFPCNNPPDNPGNFNHDDDGGIHSVQSFSQWFRDVPGVNYSRLWTTTLEWGNYPGFGDCYGYDNVNFNPVDAQLYGDGFDEHNFYFTYEIDAKFIYNSSGNQFFWFKGDDDCWIFIDGKLVIDHGGIASNREQRIDLNRMNLTNGQQYFLRLFLAERFQPQTQFHIRTNLNMQFGGSESIFAVFD